MITIRKAEDRGHADHGWLNSYHTFSFGNYYDRNHMGFRALRVINEDRVAPGMGFPTHPHRDMEIISYVVSGSLAHRDSLDNTEVIGAHGIQRFSAGTGITHSEFNPDQDQPVHFLQIWILPEKQRLQPSYEQKVFLPESKKSDWLKLASRDADQGAVQIHQDAEVYATILEPFEQKTYSLRSDRFAWVQVVRGSVTLNDIFLEQGDGAAISHESSLKLIANTTTEILLFDLA
jgi:redox-sensitive bicupin YhaK (pirin superfamily)